MPTIELPSGTIDYDVLGPEESPHPPLLFIHGIVVDNRVWTPVAELLADAGFRCVLPTLPLGSHTTPWGADHDRSPRGAAALIRDFVAALDLSTATLIANDTGGALTQMALDADFDLVAGLVFTNCDAFDVFPPQPFRLIIALMRQPWLLPALIRTMRIKALRHSPIGVGLLITDPDPDLTASVFEPLRTDARIRDDLVAFLRGIDRSELAAVTPRMSRVTVPVTVAWGSDDRCFTPALGRRFADAFPDARFIDVPGARTFVSLDQPRALADIIDSTLAAG